MSKIPKHDFIYEYPINEYWTLVCYCKLLNPRELSVDYASVKIVYLRLWGNEHTCDPPVVMLTREMMRDLCDRAADFYDADRIVATESLRSH